MIPHPEYPRPDFDRSRQWLNLNGEWDFKADPDNVGLQESWFQAGTTDWSQKIVVPFPWESKASQVNQEWLLVGWYHRTLERPADWKNLRTILNFGAVYYACTVWLNGHKVGEHTGGYLPFSFDVTGELADGPAELVVRVETVLDKSFIPHGKQRSIPADDYDGCAFTPSTGIWQTVWLEARPATYIASLKLRPNADLNAVEVQGTLEGPSLAVAKLSLAVEGQAAQEISIEGQTSFSTVLKIENPRLWSPADPYLYDVVVNLASPDGADSVRTYTGLRKIEVRGEFIFLNDQRIYVRAALDQGFWPEGIYSAPDDAALRKDVELALEAGFNMIRKHIKFENPRWLYWADKFGLLVWEEPPCFSRYSREGVELFESQLAPMVARDGNHPSIVIWGIYNEEWGLDWKSNEDEERQLAVEHAYDLLVSLDSTRPIVDDSGWWHVKTDILDWHYYDGDMEKWKAISRALATDRDSWFGHQLSDTLYSQTRLTVEGREHPSIPIINGEYGGGFLPKEQEWLFRWQTQDLRRHAAFQGYTYTELYDVEYEVVGIYTVDRQLKGWGYEPAIINADTVIIFDLTPQNPGLDLVVQDKELKVSVQVSHYGSTTLKGQLLWGWQRGENPSGSQDIEVGAFEISPLIELTSPVPEGENSRVERFYVWIATEGNPEVACGFMEAELALTGAPAQPALVS
ncbi:MAG: glycoside hydrolase family 2 [Chloroflexi bacterium]|nr:glycoside hydrolase family 2 [Chloroflexota bacterium]OJV99318.1 MAG: hypothetical protein BGO39_13840 [Chloroflexi bacterium 54-19]